jgi:hypothetical protein
MPNQVQYERVVQHWSNTMNDDIVPYLVEKTPVEETVTPKHVITTKVVLILQLQANPMLVLQEVDVNINFLAINANS